MSAIGVLVGEALEPQLAKSGITQIPGTYDALSQAFVIGKSATSRGDYSQGSGYKPSPSVPAPRYRVLSLQQAAGFTWAKGACLNQSNDLN